MAFWNDTTAQDPKRNFRFKVGIAGLHGTDQTILWYAKKVSKPNFTVTESKHAYLNHTFYWPGRVEWQPITLTLVDPVEPAGTVHDLSALMESMGYKPPGSTDAAGMVTQSKAKAASSESGLGSCTITQMDADGNTIEEWTLHAPFIKKITYGELDYENDDLTQIEVELRYDWATVTYGDVHTDTTHFSDA